MSVVHTEKKDVIWSYVGTAFYYCGSLILIPFMTAFLSSEDLGLWYIFLAIANFTQLLDAGFNPAFARNIVYCLSGAKDISSKQPIQSNSDEINWHLFRTLIKASRVFYAAISFIALCLIIVIGTPYICHISGGFNSPEKIAAWIVFAVAIFMNLYYLYSYSNLLGLGDVAGENKAKTIANCGRVVITLILLFAGFGLLAAAVGFFVHGVATRLIAIHRFKVHPIAKKAADIDANKITFGEIISVISKIYPIAWRNGAEQLALFATTQGTSIVCSLSFSLQETAQYSLALQLSNAIATLGYAFVRAHYPMYQFAYAKGDTSNQRQIIEKSVPIYWFIGMVCALGTILLFLPVLAYIRSTSVPVSSLFFVVFVYTALLNHYMIFCNLILSTNRIPFLKSVVLSSFAGLVLGALFSVVFNIGVYGLVIGQLIPQLIYNVWKWPLFVADELHSSYFNFLKNGLFYWKDRLSTLFISVNRER